MCVCGGGGVKETEGERDGVREREGGACHSHTITTYTAHVY